MSWFKKKPLPYAMPETSESSVTITPSNYGVNPSTLKSNLQESYLKVRGKITALTLERTEKLLKTWEKELPALFEKALLAKEPTIYFFNHTDPKVSNTDWILTARRFAQILDACLGLKVKVNSTSTICMTIETAHIKTLLEEPEAEKMFHQMGPYR